VIAAAAAAGAVAIVALAFVPHGSSGARAATAAPAASLSDSFSADIAQSGNVVSIVGGGTRTNLRVDLAVADEAVANGEVQVRDRASGEVCSGAVQTIDGSGLTASCAYPNGATRSLVVRWTVSGSSATGRLVERA
jgi:hypothetical protein